MTKEAKIWTPPLVLSLLATDDQAVVRAIKGLAARQTDAERAIGATKESNGRGFNAHDAPFLTDIARKLPLYNDRMTPKQLFRARQMLRKYTRQLLEIIQERGGLVEFAKPAKRETAKAPIRETASSLPDVPAQFLPKRVMAPPSIEEQVPANWGTM